MNDVDGTQKMKIKLSKSKCSSFVKRTMDVSVKVGLEEQLATQTIPRSQKDGI